MQTTPTSTTDEAKPERKHQGLKLGGMAYMLGDLAMVAASVARAPKGDRMKELGGGATGGSIWFLGGLGAAIYGNPNSEKQLDILSHKLEGFLKKEGVNIPAEARAQSHLLRDRGLWEKCERFLHEHPSEILNASYAIGSGFLLHKGLKEVRGGDKLASDFWMGAIIMVGALIGLFVKEDPQAKEKAKNGNMIEKTIAAVAEKPLQVTGVLYGANNLVLAKKAYGDFSKRNTAYPNHPGYAKPHVYSTLQLASYLFANAMLLTSKRDQMSDAGFGASQVASIEDAAARVLAAQPPAMQQQLLAQTSQFLATQKGIKREAGDIASNLAARITELTGERLQQAASTTRWVERAAAQGESPQLAR